MPKTKHEQIIKFIRDLKAGERVSVRQLARELVVSEGTAYRALKETEKLGLVSTIPKVGTVRIEDKTIEINQLSLRDVLKIIEGQIICCENKLDFLPQNYVIADSEKEEIIRRISPETVVVIGNRKEIYRDIIEHAAAIIITEKTELNEYLDLALSREVPLIFSPYDSFLTVSLINRATYERTSTKELVRVEQIMFKDTHYLSPEMTIEEWQNVAQKVGHVRFPVVDKKGILKGIVSAADAVGIAKTIQVKEIMTKDVFTTLPTTLVSHLSRMLLWEAYELIPVVDEKNSFLGIVSRKEILKTLQETQKNVKYGETIENITLSGLKLMEEDEGIKVEGEITEFMTNELGIASLGVLTMIMSSTAYILVRKTLRKDSIVESTNILHLEPLISSEKIEIVPELLKSDKNSCVVKVTILSQGKAKAISLTTVRVLKKMKNFLI